MLDIPCTDLPAFLEQEFDRMIIPGDDRGFAISRTSGDRKKCVACGLVGNRAILVTYKGEDYAVNHRTSVSLELFEELCRSMPSEMKQSRFLFEEDILDGETYLVKWVWHDEKSRGVLANARHFKDEGFRQLACRLDELMGKCWATHNK